ncbi:MAG: radical SAM protein [Ruminococcaceae bacterium]|nr:radical SAM protein [Oscillospiraceae bacterium]
MFVHSFESMAALDGKGIRFMVFLSGCPLRCVYCHNPDTQKAGGKYFTPEEIAKKASRFKPYFKNGGGVTFSGGEPLLQSGEIVSCADFLKKEGISYTLDTSLSVPLTEDVKCAIDKCESVIADLKFQSDETMEKYTGKNLENVLLNLDYIKSIKKDFILRTVVVPKLNDTLDALLSYLKIVEKYEPRYWELLPFHTMGFFKYEEGGIPNPLKDTPPMEREKLEEIKTKLREKTTIKIV